MCAFIFIICIIYEGANEIDSFVLLLLFFLLHLDKTLYFDEYYKTLVFGA